LFFASPARFLVIKISQLAHSPSGTREAFELSYSATDFEGLDLQGDIQVSGHLLRVEEGIMMSIEALKATQNTFCARCGKQLTVPMEFTQAEWLFYEEKPLKHDDENEFLFIDKHHWTIEPFEAIRQELLLHTELIVRCAKLCASFEDAGSEQGSKALASLKDQVHTLKLK
jgi:uncharacterized metal-binding protein YceD (DUF177 family)